MKQQIITVDNWDAQWAIQCIEQTKGSLTYSKYEWDILETAARNYFKKNLLFAHSRNKMPHLRAYINLKLNKMPIQFSESHLRVIEAEQKKEQLWFNIPEETLRLINRIAEKTNQPPGNIIDRLVINPLFLQHYDTNGL